jgi:hypothetical protein
MLECKLGIALVPMDAAQRFKWRNSMQLIADLLTERVSGTNDTVVLGSSCQAGYLAASFPLSSTEGRFESALPDSFIGRPALPDPSPRV